ncbi:MAG: ATP-dependent Clp protease ATP-binding subunit [Candidatus Buchananbacteria bacterium]|nr:ATP-dependent Clp protease ATP-binding subunit [Candidatus Buchananbacteria bacterium]
MEETFEKFSNNYKKSLKKAAELATDLGHELINPWHILYGLISQRGSVGAELLTSLEIKTDDIRNNIARMSQGDFKIELKTAPKFSQPAKRIIQKSIKIAYINEHKYIGTEHLLAAILEANDANVESLLNLLKVSKNEVSQQVIAILKSASKIPALTETFKVIEKEEDYEDYDFLEKKQSVLDLFGTELTSKRMQKKIDSVIGRDEEILRIIHILSRRNKNNPIILGEPGVGKTAIVEGLAKKIVNGEVPETLLNKKIYMLDLTSTVSGTMYRGEFEGRIKQIIDEVRNRPEVILFIDEIHNIVGTGSASGSMDAANILKPALARGEIRCIGATTFGDYRKSIENDPALNRRFQPVKLVEPSEIQTKEILQGIKNYFENFHRVEISDEAINFSVELSQKYITDKFLPDKAIDLIDEASAAIRVNKKPSALEQKIKKLRLDILELQKKKNQAVIDENYDLAIKLKNQSQELEDELSKMEERIKTQKDKMIGTIFGHDIAKIVAKSTGIPAEDLIASEKRKIMRLDNSLQKKIIGQDKATSSIAQFIKRAKAGLTPENKPLASFLLLGPSGTGKTHTARILAEELFGQRDALIKIDMSEYSEKFNTSKLIGAPAGYVGYKESGQLTEKVKHKPYSIVLFDEIEKANPDIFDLLLQVLEDGYLTDAAGTRINFRNTIIIMTSNIGSQHFSDKNEMIGFDSQTGKINSRPKEKIMEEIKDFFKIEFINRLDEIIYFSPLLENDLEKITKLEFDDLASKLSRKGIQAEFDQSVAKIIAKESQKIDQGARGIKKTMQKMIESIISQKMLEDEITAGSIIKITAEKGKIKIKV